MGRCVTPKYRVTINGQCGDFPRGTGIGPTFWEKHLGKPTSENLAKILRGYQSSTEPGGVNGHLGREPLPQSAEIIRQSDEKVVARFRCPGGGV